MSTLTMRDQDRACRKLKILQEGWPCLKNLWLGLEVSESRSNLPLSSVRDEHHVHVLYLKVYSADRHCFTAASIAVQSANIPPRYQLSPLTLISFHSQVEVDSRVFRMVNIGQCTSQHFYESGLQDWFVRSKVSDSNPNFIHLQSCPSKQNTRGTVTPLAEPRSLHLQTSTANHG